MQSNSHRAQVLKRFYNVTEGTCCGPLWLPIHPSFLHIVLLILPFFHLVAGPLRRQRLRLDFFHAPPLQPQNPVAAARERQVMRCNEGGELVLAV